MKNESLELLGALALEMGVSLSDGQINEFDMFGDLLIEWNKKFNLTAIKDEAEVVVKHFIDSLSVVRFVKAPEHGADDCKGATELGAVKLIDVGAGAGFPGLPLKIALRGGISAVLFESVGKKVNFIETAIRTIGLTNINAVHMRAEDAGRTAEYRESADIAVARAVARLPVLLEYCVPLLKQGGVFIAMKSAGETVEQELDASKNALSVLGCAIEGINRFVLPKTDIKRTIITVRKIARTSSKYPRKPGTPAIAPI
jgi:16S rRNA (guanine527-N7)-methyltransferase